MSDANPVQLLEAASRRKKAHRGFWKNLWLVIRTIQARLRFVVILLAMGGVIAYWDTLKAYYEKWVRPAEEITAVGPHLEYFCPMHPQIIRENNKEKCPICFMPLSRRKKLDGPEAALPAGIVSRVQLSPYRIALAGVQTSPVSLQPLHKEIVTVGSVEFDERKSARISARLTGRSRIDKLYVNVTGQTVQKGDELAQLYNPELVTTVRNLLDGRRSRNEELERSARERLWLWGIDKEQIDRILTSGQALTHLTIRSPIGGHVLRKYQMEGEYVEEGARLYDVVDLGVVWIQAQVYEEDLALLREGMPVSASTLAFPNRQFTGKVAFIQPHLDQNTRTITVRLDIDNPNHELRPGMYATVKLEVSASQLDLLASNASEEEKRSLQNGQALAVPEGAVIDTGTRKIVYRQASPDLFEGVEVWLGPRMVGLEGATFYPVVRGLKAGDLIVGAGSFLIDAETRLNPAAGSIYFGGIGSKESPSPAMQIRPSTPPEQESAPPGVAGKQYDIKAKVISLADDKTSVRLDHEDIPGLMEGMKMKFAVKDPQVLNGISPGDKVQGVLEMRSGGAYVITSLEKR